MPSFAPLESTDEMDVLVSSYLHVPQARSTHVLPQFRHRLKLAGAWRIPAGSRILDIGCGQGESTLVLAQTNGANGHVTGIDTAPPDYGKPYTVSEAQGHIKRSVLGSRIDFLRTDVVSLLTNHYDQFDNSQSSVMRPFDCAVLCHSLWYFPDLDGISSLFRTLAAAGVPRVHIADYSYVASLPEQQPHVLASQLQALLHASKQPRQTGAVEPNVRAAPEPARVVEQISREGYRLVEEGLITPGAELRDGHYEAKYVQMPLFQAHMARERLTENQRAQIDALIPEVRRVSDELREKGHEYMRTMDVWWATFDLEKF